MSPLLPVTTVLVLCLLLLLVLAMRPAVTRTTGGKILAFVGIFLLPSLALTLGFGAHLDHAKKREFCLSCHTMHPYGKSLLVDDEEFVPAMHYQNNWVPREKACYTCHTTYAMFGDAHSKIRGLRHLVAFYSGSVPDTLHLYEPYNNRECLHCHGGAREFEEESAHHEADTTMAAMKSNRLSCLTSGCHDVAHNVDELDEVDFWKEPGR